MRFPHFIRGFLRRLIARVSPPLPLGRRGEHAAARFLRRRGMIIVAHGERDSLGELDLVAVDGETVVFVEVKTRRSLAAGHPTEAVDHDKRRRITRAALRYLHRHDLLDHPSRFDVVAVIWPREAPRPKITHYRSAFEAEGDVY